MTPKMLMRQEVKTPSHVPKSTRSDTRKCDSHHGGAREPCNSGECVYSGSEDLRYFDPYLPHLIVRKELIRTLYLSPKEVSSSSATAAACVPCRSGRCCCRRRR